MLNCVVSTLMIVPGPACPRPGSWAALCCAHCSCAISAALVSPVMVASAVPGMLNGASNVDLPIVSMLEWRSVKRMRIWSSIALSMTNGSMPRLTASFTLSLIHIWRDCLWDFMRASIVLQWMRKSPQSPRRGSAMMLHH